MASKQQQEQERALVKEALHIGPQSDRRRFFVSAAAFGAAAAAPGLAQAQAAPAAPARKVLIKDDSRLLNIGATVRSGNYWDFSTFITPVEEFYVRNHYPTPIAEAKPVLDPKQWRMKIHGNGLERSLEISYDDLLKMPSRTIIATMECHGNGRSLFWEQQNQMQVAGGNWVLGAVGQAEWQYVPLSHIFGLLGLKKDAKSALFWSGVRHRHLLQDEWQRADAGPRCTRAAGGAGLGRDGIDQMAHRDAGGHAPALVPAQHPGRGLHWSGLLGACGQRHR
jgi:DMSO/TMAO reductase YedYZ molybdopterin-dependent catalytic subunit